MGSQITKMETRMQPDMMFFYQGGEFVPAIKSRYGHELQLVTGKREKKFTDEALIPMTDELIAQKMKDQSYKFKRELETWKNVKMLSDLAVDVLQGLVSIAPGTYLKVWREGEQRAEEMCVMCVEERRIQMTNGYMLNNAKDMICFKHCNTTIEKLIARNVTLQNGRIENEEDVAWYNEVCGWMNECAFYCDNL